MLQLFFFYFILNLTILEEVFVILCYKLYDFYNLAILNDFKLNLIIHLKMNLNKYLMIKVIVLKVKTRHF